MQIVISLAVGHIQSWTEILLNMAFGQDAVISLLSWGVAPGYDDAWPSAKTNGTQMCNFKKRKRGTEFVLFLAHAAGTYVPRLFDSLFTHLRGLCESCEQCRQKNQVAEERRSDG